MLHFHSVIRQLTLLSTVILSLHTPLHGWANASELELDSVELDSRPSRTTQPLRPRVRKPKTIARPPASETSALTSPDALESSDLDLEEKADAPATTAPAPANSETTISQESPPQDRTKLRKMRKTKGASAGGAKGAVFEKSKVFVRFMHDQRQYGVMHFGSTFPVALNFSAYFAAVFRGASGSGPEADLQAFGTAVYLYTPHWNGLGLVGHHSDSSGTNNHGVRGGVSYRFLAKGENLGFALIPMIFPFAESANRGRFAMHFALDVYKRIGVSGTLSYVLSEPKETWSVAPTFYIEVLSGFRLVSIYDYNSAPATLNGGWQFGVQLANTF